MNQVLIQGIILEGGRSGSAAGSLGCAKGQEFPGLGTDAQGSSLRL